MTEHFKLMVPGATANGSYDVTAPFDGTPIATVETGGTDAVDTALATADNRRKEEAKRC